MTTQTLTALRQLKLGGMANALQSQLEQIGTYEGLAFTKRLALLVEQECLSHEQRKQERLIRQARFKLASCVQDIHCGDQPATDRSMVCQHRRQHPRRRHPGPTDAQRTPASTQGGIHAQDTQPIDGR